MYDTVRESSSTNKGGSRRPEKSRKNWIHFHGQGQGHGQGQCRTKVEGHGQGQCRGMVEGHGQCWRRI